MMKKTQWITVWLLPLIIIGGFFNPLLGYLVVAMMAFLIVLSFSKGRYWCWNLCPRGAFLDSVVAKLSPQEPTPKIFLKQWFRWLVFVLFMSFLVIRIVGTGGNFLAIGAVFIVMCTVTTVIAMVLGVTTKHRSWCVICPMGTLQDALHQRKNPYEKTTK